MNLNWRKMTRCKTATGRNRAWVHSIVIKTKQTGRRNKESVIINKYETKKINNKTTEKLNNVKLQHVYLKTITNFDKNIIFEGKR